MRELGRLLLQLRKGDLEANIKICIYPAQFQEVVDTMLDMTSGEDGTCSDPLLALKLGHPMHDVAEIGKTYTIIGG